MARSSKLRGGEHGWLENAEWVDGRSEWVAGQLNAWETLSFSKGHLVFASCLARGLHHKPLTCANVANPRSVRGWSRTSWRPTHADASAPTLTHPLMLFCSAHTSLRATATQTILPMREQLPPQGHHHKTWKLQISKRKLLVNSFFGRGSFWTGNALKSWRTTWWYCVTRKNFSN